MTAGNLAVALAQAGKQVVLVDADLHRPRQHRQFGLRNNVGLTTALLAGSAGLEDLLQPTAVPGLSVLTSGPLPPNPAELLGSGHMRDLMAALAARTRHGGLRHAARDGAGRRGGVGEPGGRGADGARRGRDAAGGRAPGRRSRSGRRTRGSSARCSTVCPSARAATTTTIITTAVAAATATAWRRQRRQAAPGPAAGKSAAARPGRTSALRRNAGRPGGEGVFHVWGGNERSMLSGGPHRCAGRSRSRRSAPKTNAPEE